MPSERLDALLRQRQLIRDHLTWLDSVITATSDPAPLPPTTPPPLSSPLSPATNNASPPATPPAGKLVEADPEALARANALADSLLHDYHSKNPDTPATTRHSCLLLTIAFVLFCTAAVMAVYLSHYR
jgi:hypothetical protein